MRHNEKYHLKKKWLHLTILYFKMNEYKNNLEIYEIKEEQENNEELFQCMFGEK